MTYACGRQFIKYMEKFLPVLEMGLSQHQVGAWALCVWGCVRGKVWLWLIGWWWLLGSGNAACMAPMARHVLGCGRRLALLVVVESRRRAATAVPGRQGATGWQLGTSSCSPLHPAGRVPRRPDTWPPDTCPLIPAPLLARASSPQEWQVCSVTVGVLGDICRAIEEQILPFCDRIMLLLVQDLQSTEVHRNIKPQILSAFGDVALAIGDKFVVRLCWQLASLGVCVCVCTRCVWFWGCAAAALSAAEA